MSTLPFPEDQRETYDTECEMQGVHVRGTGHSQTDCPTLDDRYNEEL